MNDPLMNEETPVRIPTRIREDAFYYDERNCGVLNGSTHYSFFVPSPKRHTPHIEAFIIGLGLGTLVLALVGLHALGIALLFVGALGLLGMIISEPFRWKKELNERFPREGYVVLGEILTCIAYIKRAGQYAYFMVEIEYRYRAPNGDFFTSSINAQRPDLNGTQLPPPGTPVYVLYFSEQEAYLL